MSYLMIAVQQYILWFLTWTIVLFLRFISKPKKGIKFLQEKGLLAKEPEEVAKFFHEDVRINKAAMGDYMGESDEWGS